MKLYGIDMYIIYLWSILMFLRTGVSGIDIFNMQDMCGHHLNLRWKGIHTAEIRLNSQTETRVISTSENFTSGVEDESVHHRSSVTQKSSYVVVSGMFFCTLAIESWDFQDKIMFYFKGVQAETRCTDARLEMLDGASHTSQPVEGLERPICNQRGPRFAGKIFKTSDKYLTLRLSGLEEYVSNISASLVVVTYNDGECRSYEHKCPSGICIMEELVCNGNNPCGDKSDCPVMPTEVASFNEEPHVIHAAIITASLFCVGVVIGVVIFCRCYHKRLKLRRQRLHQLSLERGDQELRIEDEVVERNDTDVQNEADIELFSPPSYESLKIDYEECLKESKNSNLPPSYSCVMSHQDKFHLSYTDLNKIKPSTLCRQVSMSETDIRSARS